MSKVIMMVRGVMRSVGAASRVAGAFESGRYPNASDLRILDISEADLRRVRLR